ncbi:MAG: hypothetical protein RI897_4365 [Verrucomicrobiota bacterium]|jgi:ABC-type multidrug transport system permease subunit
MRQVGNIGHHALRVFFRDRALLVWTVLVPLAFMYFMGFAVRVDGRPGRPEPLLRVDNADAGFLGEILEGQLSGEGLRVVRATNSVEGVGRLVIPEGFTDSVLGLEAVKLAYEPAAESGDPLGALTELRLFKAMVRMNLALVEHALKEGTNRVPTSEGVRDLLLEEPMVELRSSYAGRRPVPSAFNLSVPGNIVMYLMMNLLIFGGASVAWERRSGVLRRVMVHPVRPWEWVTGRVYGLMLLGLIQVMVLLAAGQFLFGVEVGADLGLIFLTLMIYAWVAGSFGVLMGSWILSEDKVVGLCILASLVMAALGGCWWPLEIVPDSMKVVAHVVPSGWAMDALHQLISFGGGWVEVRGALGVLVMFGLAAHGGAVWLWRGGEGGKR